VSELLCESDVELDKLLRESDVELDLLESVVVVELLRELLVEEGDLSSVSSSSSPWALWEGEEELELEGAVVSDWSSF